MSAIENNKDKGTQGQQNQQGQKQNQDLTSHMGERVPWQPGQKQVSTDKERKPGEPAQNPQGGHGQKGVGGKILGQEGQQRKPGEPAQNPQGNFQQVQSRYQGDQGKMRNENRDVDKDSVSE